MDSLRSVFALSSQNDWGLLILSRKYGSIKRNPDSGDKDKALIYDVSRVRDGRSFCTRFVKTIQGGRTIFTASISFQVIEPDSIVHQAPMPDVPPPEECEDAVSFRNR
jgi:acyl-CoA thioesterase II